MKKFIRLQVLFLLICANLFASEGEKTLAPTASFVVSATEGCAPLTVTFTSTSTSPGDPIVSYTWDFGDGTIQTTSTPSIPHTYTSGGPGPSYTWDVQLTVTTASSATNTYLWQNLIYVSKPDLGPDAAYCQDAFFWGVTLSPKVPGGSDFTYLWSDGTNFSDAVVYDAGTYWVRVTDGNGCVRADTIVITEAPSLNIKYGVREVLNCGGQVTFEFTDSTEVLCGSGALSYFIEDDLGNTETSPNFSLTYFTEGTYNVRIEISDGPWGPLLGTITIPVTVAFSSAPLTPPNLGPDKNICLGNSVTLDAGYEPGVSYSWSPATGLSNTNTHNPVASPTTTTIYTVTKTKCGDTETGSVTVNIGPPLTVNLGADFSMCAGEIMFANTGVTGATSTTWTCSTDPGFGAATGNSASAIILQPGVYTATVVKDGCAATDTLVVTAKPRVVAAFSAAQTSTCTPTVTITDATVLSCTSSSNYRWDFGDGTVVVYTPAVGVQKNPTHVYASPGTYTITQIVYLNATERDTATQTITVTGGATVDLGADRTICAGGSTILDAGVYPGATYSWSTGATTQSITVSATGQYSVEVVTGGCTLRDTVNVTVAAALGVNLGSDRTICSGTSTTLDAGVYPGATYLWSTGATTQTVAANTSGEYWVEVTSGGCTGRDTINVTVASAIVVDLGPEQAVCSGTPLILDAGDFPGATYLWSTGATTRTISVTATDEYKVTVTLGTCSASDSVLVEVSHTPEVTLGADITVCSGTPVNLDAGNFLGATYLWSTGAGGRYLNGITTPGTYSVSVTMLGCVGRDTIVITHTAAPTVNIGADFSMCAGDTRTLDAGAGFITYEWSTGETSSSIAINTPGTYWVRVTAAGGCTTTDTIVVSAAAAPTVTLGTDFSMCVGDTRTLDAGAGFSTYEWSTGETSSSISINTPGTYWVRVTNAAGCTATDTIVVSAEAAPTVNLGTDFGMCVGDTRTLDAGAGYSTYEWSTGETSSSISISAPGTYWVRVTNAGGCTATDTIVVTSSASFTVNLGPDQTMCRAGGVAVLTVNVPGATSIRWGAESDPLFETTFIDNPVALADRPGTYWVTVTRGGCSVSDTIVITPTNGVNVGFTANQLTTCAPFNVKFESNTLTTITCGARSRYVWNFGDGNVVTYTTAPGSPIGIPQRNPEHSYLLPGSYNVTLTVVNTNNDSASYTLPITVTGSGAAVNLGNDTTICSGGTLVLDAGDFPGATYDWGNGNVGRTLSVTETGLYRVYVTLGGCTTVDSIQVNVVGNLDVNLGNDTTVCVGSTITLDAGYPGASYLWITGATSQTISPVVNESTTYTVAVSKDGCSGNGEIRVNVTNSLSVTLGNDTTICSGSGLTLDAGYPGASYLWNDGVTTQVRNITTAGEYTVTVTNGGCSGTAGIQVSLIEAPTGVDLPTDTTVCFGNAIQLDAGNPGSDYLWSTGATTQTIVVSSSGNYSVDVTACGVTVSHTINVVTNNAPAPFITLSGNQLVSTEADSYQWYKGGELIPGATSKILKPKGYGVYNVVVGSGTCLGDASYYYVPSGEIYLGDIRVKVTPNPSYGQPKLVLSKLPAKPIQVSVFDRVGRKILMTQITNTVTELNLTGFARGEYFAEMVLDDKRVIVPIITQ